MRHDDEWADRFAEGNELQGGRRPDYVVGKNGVHKPSRSISHDADVVAERKIQALDMACEDLSHNDIAKALGISRSTVQRYIQDAMHAQGKKKCPHCNGTGMVEA